MWEADDGQLAEYASLPFEELTSLAAGSGPDATAALTYLWRSVLRPVIVRRSRKVCSQIGHRGAPCRGDCDFAYPSAFNKAVKKLTAVSYDRTVNPDRSFEYRDPDSVDQQMIRATKKKCLIRDWHETARETEDPSERFNKAVNVALKGGQFVEEVRRQWNTDRQTEEKRIVQRIQKGSFKQGEANELFVMFGSLWADLVTRLADGDASQRELLRTIRTLEFVTPTLSQLVNMLVIDYRDACDNTYSDVPMGLDSERLHRALRLTSEEWFTGTTPAQVETFFVVLEGTLKRACASIGHDEPEWLQSFANVRDVSRILDRPRSTVDLEMIVETDTGWEPVEETDELAVGGEASVEVRP